MSEPLPRIYLTLEEFCQRAQTLREEDEAAFVKFVLCGTLDDRQAVIDTNVNGIEDDDEICVTRDYDSILGLTWDIMIVGPLMIYPLSRREDTLSVNVHFSYHFTNESVCHLSFFVIIFNYLQCSTEIVGFATP